MIVRNITPGDETIKELSHKLGLKTPLSMRKDKSLMFTETLSYKKTTKVVRINQASDFTSL